MVPFLGQLEEMNFPRKRSLSKDSSVPGRHQSGVWGAFRWPGHRGNCCPKCHEGPAVTAVPLVTSLEVGLTFPHPGGTCRPDPRDWFCELSMLALGGRACNLIIQDMPVFQHKVNRFLVFVFNLVNCSFDAQRLVDSPVVVTRYCRWLG